MKVYISGLIIGDEINELEFIETAKALKEMGHDVFNPRRIKKPETYKEFIDENLKELMNCDAIYMLRDGQDSEKAKLEKKYAEIVGMIIMHGPCYRYRGKEIKND